MQISKVSNRASFIACKHDVDHWSPDVEERFKCVSNEKVYTPVAFYVFFFFNLREVKVSVRESAPLAVREVIIFWNKARIPTRL